MARLIICLLFIGSACVLVKAQRYDYATKRSFYDHIGYAVYEGDTIPFFQFREVYVYPPLKFKNNKEWQEYMRLVRNVKIVLPFAAMINNTLIETYEYMETLPPKERKAHIKKVEDGLMAQYKPMFKKLSYTQGKLLIKIVDRQCDSPSFDLIKAFVGSFRANFYQSFAAVFGASLKKQFDAKGEDKLTERVIVLVQNHQL